MGRSPGSDENGLKKGPWTPEEDRKLVEYIQKNGHASWRALPKLAGLNRCGKSCRLRWTNYLRPDIKRGKFSQEEEQTILHLHSILGNKWSAIAAHLPGRTDNEIKNFWNTHLKKKLIQMGFDPMTHQPRTDLFASLPHLIALANLRDLLDQPPLMEEQVAMKVQAAEAIQFAKLQYFQYLLQLSAASAASTTNYNNPYGQINSINADIEALGLFMDNSNPLVMDNSVLNSTQLQNQPLFSFENQGYSQPLHNAPKQEDPQVPFSFQTPLINSGMGEGINDTAMMVSQGDYNPPNSPWVLPSPSSSSCPLGDASSTSSHGGGVSSDWPELLFEEPFMHA